MGQAATMALQTSASDLKALLAKAGRPLKTGENLDKLEVCSSLADQIKWVLRHNGKMQLSLGGLNAFLVREGMSEVADFKSAVSKIIHLVHLQQERLNSHGRPRESRQSADCDTRAIDDLLALVVMDKKSI